MKEKNFSSFWNFPSIPIPVFILDIFSFSLAVLGGRFENMFLSTIAWMLILIRQEHFNDKNRTVTVSKETD